MLEELGGTRELALPVALAEAEADDLHRERLPREWFPSAGSEITGSCAVGVSRWGKSDRRSLR